MTEKEFFTPLCDVHNDKVAQTFCKYHKGLLCLSCVLEKAKSQECSIHEITEISGEQDTTLYEWILVRQMAIRKRRSIEAYDNKTEMLKSTLKKEVTELHEKLVKRLDEMKESCLQSIDTQAETLKQEADRKEQLDSFDKIIAENIEKLSTESIDEFSSIRTSLNELKTKLKKEVSDISGEPQGHFDPNKRLEDFIFQTKDSLGKSCLTSLNIYEPIEVNHPGIQNEKESSDLVESGGFKDPTLYQSSDELYPDTKKTDKVSKAVSTDMPMETFPENEKLSESKVNTDLNKPKEDDDKPTRISESVEDVSKNGGCFKGLFRRKHSDKTNHHDIEKDTETMDKTANQTALKETNTKL